VEKEGIEKFTQQIANWFKIKQNYLAKPGGRGAPSRTHVAQMSVINQVKVGGGAGKKAENSDGWGEDKG